jgi:hypothetical protein
LGALIAVTRKLFGDSRFGNPALPGLDQARCFQVI